MTGLEEEHTRLKDKKISITAEEIENLGIETANGIVSEIMSVVKKHSATLPKDFLADLEKVFDDGV
jgi:hypothetical protein